MSAQVGGQLEHNGRAVGRDGGEKVLHGGLKIRYLVEEREMGCGNGGCRRRKMLVARVVKVFKPLDLII